MCGILAHYKTNKLTPEDVALASNALNSMANRGPDGEGFFLINTHTGNHIALKTKDTPSEIITIDSSSIDVTQYNLIFAHRRLSIFDLSVNGFQPMICPKTGNLIIFNGEIYNWFEIREDLKTKGYSFRTDTDTEVIFAAYDYYGEDCLKHFNGMWSFCLFDKKKQQLFVSNDRFGVKPLFYISTEKEIIFSSTLKQTSLYKKLRGDLNIPIIQYYLERYLLHFNEQTFFKNIFSFPKSNFVKIDLNHHNIQLNFKAYYQLNIEQKNNLKIEDAREQFKLLLNDAVKLRLRADVPVGVAVSGGLDSSSIFYFVYKQLKQQHKEGFLNTFSVTFPNYKEDESKHINELLTEYKCRKHQVNALNEFSMNDFRKFISLHDYPADGASYYSDYCLSRLTATHGVKVLLNGQGADEAFAGYHHHFYKYLSSLLIHFDFAKYKVQLNDYAFVKGQDKQKIKEYVFADIKNKLKNRIGINSKQDIFSVFQKWQLSKNLNEQMQMDMLHNTIPFYLASNDRNGMAFGVESRHPFMDYRLIEFGYSIPDEYKINKGYQKYIIREAMDELPDTIRWRKDKLGFAAPDEEFLKIFKSEINSSNNRVTDLGLEFKEEFKYYSLHIWLEEFV